MKIKQIYTACLAQGAYYISSEGEAAIIDPLREITPYIKRAAADRARIKYIFETHFHADFVSGHLTLAEKTGASIVYGPMATPNFAAHIAQDNEEFTIGKIRIKVLHTPGHTIESSTFLLIDENGNKHAIFTGDTLFLGDVGRPDLAQKAADMTQEELAAILYDSIRLKIMPLADNVIVYPGHGAGSACGKNMMKETIDTLGNQKRVNYALRADMTKEEFIAEVTDGLLPPPAYFPFNVKMNKEGYQSIDTILENGLRPLSPSEFEVVAQETKAIVLDVRSPQEFAQSHIPSSIFIGIDGTFAPWVGELIVDIRQPIVLVVPEGREKETVTRLSRIGFDNTLGYLKGGISAWTAAGKQVDTVVTITAKQLEQVHADNKFNVYDVRKQSEYLSEHISDANNTPLNFLNDLIAEFPKDETFYIHCAGGYRSMIAASILKAKGYHNLVEIQGGFSAIQETDIPKTDFVCPSTL